MKYLVFKSYDRGFLRSYFMHDKALYCVQPWHHYLPALLVCSYDGEPSHLIEDATGFTFTNMPPDGDSWAWDEILAYFQIAKITSNGGLMRRMNELFEVLE